MLIETARQKKKNKHIVLLCEVVWLLAAAAAAAVTRVANHPKTTLRHNDRFKNRVLIVSIIYNIDITL